MSYRANSPTSGDEKEMPAATKSTSPPRRPKSPTVDDLAPVEFFENIRNYLEENTNNDMDFEQETTENIETSYNTFRANLKAETPPPPPPESFILEFLPNSSTATPVHVTKRRTTKAPIRPFLHHLPSQQDATGLTTEFIHNHSLSLFTLLLDPE